MDLILWMRSNDFVSLERVSIYSCILLSYRGAVMVTSSMLCIDIDAVNKAIHFKIYK